MKDNMLYNFYLKPGTDYFERNQITEQNKYSISKETPKHFKEIIVEESVWTYYHNSQNILPDQGWKIHISCLYDEAEKILDTLSNVCFEKGLDFKHLKDTESYIMMNSKNASRSSSGKFITIYPGNNEEFLETLFSLENALKTFSTGPYILSDKRWKDTNIYYRYGGFVNISNDLGELCIRDPEGNLIKDERNPYYHVPYFMKDFDDHLNTLNTQIDNSETSKLKDYQMISALSFSNAGGVYYAKRKKDDLKVIVKEARPKAGLDGHLDDALTRQNAEYEALINLAENDGIVDVIDRFKEWEHHFLIEEFIEGEDLKTWLSLYFPFYEDDELILSYCKKAEQILKNLLNVVEKMNKSNIAMMDLQPANILVKEDLSVKLIDFETAVVGGSTVQPSLMTVGFASSKIKNNLARDWFGLKKIIKYMALPVINSEDLDEELEQRHYRWIEKNYPEKFNKKINALLKICDDNIKEITYSNSNINEKKLNVELNFITNKLLNGITKSLTNDERFIYGDIRQYELDFGKYNYLTGGAGAALTLIKNNYNVHLVKEWVEKYILKEIEKESEYGLLTGKTGILPVLYELGYKELVLNQIEDIYNKSLSKDYTLRSGLSGIGLFILSLYIENKDLKFLEMAINIEKRIDRNYDINKFNSQDWSAINNGLIDGYSGISLFYSALYGITKDKKYIKISEDLINKELKTGIYELKTGVLQLLDDKGRILPYLSGGSIGLGIAMWFYNHVSDDERFKDDIEAIVNLSSIRSTITGGLFDGAGSFLLLPSLITDSQVKSEVCGSILNLVELFIIDRASYYKYSGQFSYRISDDVYSGSSGIILGLKSIVNENPLNWLPLINIEKFVNQCGYTK